MCGFSGYVDFSGVSNGTAETNVRKMAERIHHRGPDGIGYYIDEHCAMAHARLSVIDLSAGLQPWISPDGRYVLVFNGEIYNHLELRKQLESSYKYKTRCDTETLLYSYLEWGEQCVEKIRGMFSFLVLDKTKKTVFAARDRLGKKPLYYCVKDGAFVFASELKALMVHPLILKKVNIQAVVDYLRLGYCPAPDTPIDDVKKLEAGSYLKFSQSGVAVQKYWCVNKLRRTKEDDLLSAQKKVSELLKSSVECRLESDVPKGGFLSGGVDSTLITLVAKELGETRYATQTVIFDFDEVNESQYAEDVSIALHTEHAETHVGANVAADLKRILWHMDEPFADDSAIPTFYLCKSAKERMSVALSGDGADEVFGGYSWYWQLLLNQNLARRLPRSIRRIISRFFSNESIGYWRGKSLLGNLGVEAEEQHVHLRSIFNDNQIINLLGAQASASLKEHPFLEKYKSVPDGWDLVTRAQAVDLQLYLSEDILMKVDKMSMAHGLEVRAPFLDHLLVEYSLTLPVNCKLQKSVGKRILRAMLKGAFSKKFVFRRKQGFGTPLAHWLVHELNDLVSHYLLNHQNGSGIFDRQEVAKLWDLFLSRRKAPLSLFFLDLSRHIWCLLCFEIWYDLYINENDCLGD